MLQVSCIVDDDDDDMPKLDQSVSTPTAVPREEKHQDIPATPARIKSDQCQESSLKRKYGNSPLPDPLPFPDNFSVAVQQAISNGSVLPVRRQLINDIGSFYLGLTNHPQQGDYKRMALLICQKFPELRDTSPSSYWVRMLY